MKLSDLAAFLLMIAGLGIVFVLAVNAIWPPEPHPLKIDAQVARPMPQAPPLGCAPVYVPNATRRPSPFNSINTA